MSNVWVKGAISLIAVLLIAARWIWPDINIDSITIGLFLVALIPWLTSIVESMKFPGGWEVKLRDVSEAGRKVTSNAPQPVSTPAKTREVSFLSIADQDPNLALVSLRIEIETRVRELASLVEIPPDQPLSRLLRALEKQGTLNNTVFSGLQEIIMAGNQAAHGAKVEPSLSDWAFSNGPKVVATLDAMLDEMGSL